jgi:hypothetical protein
MHDKSVDDAIERVAQLKGAVEQLRALYSTVVAFEAQPLLGRGNMKSQHRRVLVVAVPPSPVGTAPGQWAHQVDDHYFAEHPEVDECWRAMVPGEFAREVWQPPAGFDWVVHVRRTPSNAYRRTVSDGPFLRAEGPLPG